MRLDFKKGAVIIIVCLIAGLMFYGLLSLPSLSEDTNRRHTLEVLEVLHKAAAQCYALEGEYPQNIDYLHDKYGVILDRDRYIYFYDTGGIGNMRPDIKVEEKNNGAEG